MATRRFPVALCVLAAIAVLAPGASANGKPPPAVSLGEGKLGEFQWWASARRGSGAEGGPHGGQRPFVTLAIGHPAHGYYGVSELGAGTGTPGHLTAKSPPTTVIASESAKGTTISAVAMVFAPAAVRIEVEDAHGETEKIHLRQLNAVLARKARLERIRYTAFAVRGEWCADRITSFNAKGAKLWENSEGGCGGEEGEASHRSVER